MPRLRYIAIIGKAEGMWHRKGRNLKPYGTLVGVSTRWGLHPGRGFISKGITMSGSELLKWVFKRSQGIATEKGISQTSAIRLAWLEARQLGYFKQGG